MGFGAGSSITGGITARRFIRRCDNWMIDRTTATPQVFFKPGGLAAAGALHRKNYKLEIAGYKLD